MYRGRTALRLLVALQVQSQPTDQRNTGANPIDALLHLPVAAIATLNGVGGRWQQLVVQEGQRLLQVGRIQLVQTLAQTAIASQTLTQLRQLAQGGVRSAAAVEQTIDLVHDRPQGSQSPVGACQAQQQGTLGGTEVTADEQMPMREQSRDRWV